MGGLSLSDQERLKDLVTFFLDAGISTFQRDTEEFCSRTYDTCEMEQ